MPRVINQSVVVVAAAYLPPLALVFLLWIVIGSTRSVGEIVPLRYQLLVAVWNAAGPLAFLFDHLHKTPLALVFLVVAIWTAWLTLVLTTPLKNVPVHLHLLATCAWLFAGFMRTSLLVT